MKVAKYCYRKIDACQGAMPLSFLRLNKWGHIVPICLVASVSVYRDANAISAILSCIPPLDMVAPFHCSTRTSAIIINCFLITVAACGSSKEAASRLTRGCAVTGAGRCRGGYSAAASHGAPLHGARQSPQHLRIASAANRSKFGFAEPGRYIALHYLRGGHKNMRPGAAVCKQHAEGVERAAAIAETEEGCSVASSIDSPQYARQEFRAGV